MTGLNVFFVNQFGKEIRKDAELSNYVKQVMNPLSLPNQHTHNKSFHIEISRPKEIHIRENLKAVHCIGILRGLRNPCRTSLVNIRYTQDEPGMKLHAYGGGGPGVS